MVKKRKFVTFLLSAVPGLGHFYLGLMNRGLAVMGAFIIFGVVIGSMSELMHVPELLMFLVLLPVIWFYGLFDALSLCQKFKVGEPPEDRSPLLDLSESLASGNKSRFWALIFGAIPGAGHMYLGWQEKGLQIMSLFFLSIFVMDWLRLSIVLFLVPVVWFYSFFDVLQLVSGTLEQPDNTKDNIIAWLTAKQRWVGVALILIGILVLFDRLLVPYLDYRIVDAMKTGLVAILLIGGGLRLAMGAKVDNQGTVKSLANSFEPEDQEDKVVEKSEVAKTCVNGE